VLVREKSIRFGCALAASLFVVVLAGCGGGSESSSSRTAEPSKKSPPAQHTSESHAGGAGGSANCTTSPTCSALSTSRARLCARAWAAGVCTLRSRILAAEDCKPIPNARIEFWLANPLGESTTMRTGLRC
jgi:protocatechuate 3,4-dioxygenase beta subunit